MHLKKRRTDKGDDVREINTEIGYMDIYCERVTKKENNKKSR